MSASSEIAALLDALPNSDDKIASLENLKTLLSSVNPGTLRDIVPNTSFDVIFECLRSDDKDQVTLSCAVLSLLLQGIDSPAVLAQFHGELLVGLSHTDEQVKELCLTQIVRAAVENPQQLSLHNDLVIHTADLLGEEKLSVAKQAEVVLVTLGQTNDGLDCVFQEPVLDRLHAVCQTSDIVRFRVYETMTRIMCHSPEGLSSCSRSGFLQQLINEVYRDDLLTQLNSLELLKDLALTPHGLAYLDEQGVVGKLQELLVTAQSDPLAGFLMPGLIKFFGNVASLFPKEVCGRFKDFMALVFDLLQGDDVTFMVLAAETLAVIGGTLEGKMALEKQGNQMSTAMKKTGSLINNAPTEIRVRGLTVVSTLISLQGEMQTTELLSLTEQWFSHLFPKPVSVLKSIASQPFTDLRVVAFGVLGTLANLPWGQRLLNSEAGFTEYLLDRSTEKAKEGKDSKYDIVKILAESPTSGDIFGAPYLMRLRHYVNEGPYYVRVEAAVAFEEAS